MTMGGQRLTIKSGAVLLYYTRPIPTLIYVTSIKRTWTLPLSVVGNISPYLCKLRHIYLDIVLWIEHT